MKYVSLPEYKVESESVFLNGRKLDSTTPLELRVLNIGPEEYNIDLLLECGDSVEYLDYEVTSTSSAKIVVTDVGSNYKEDDYKLGIYKIIQIVKVNTEEDIPLAIKIKDVTYNVTIKLEKYNGEEPPIYIPNFKTEDDVSMFPSGMADYPVSSLELPLPMHLNKYHVSWIDYTENFELGSNNVSVSLYYNQEAIKIHNEFKDVEEDDLINELTNINNLVLEIDSDILQLENLNRKDFLLPIAFEFKDNNNVILHSKVITLARVNIYLSNIWKKKLVKLPLPNKNNITDSKNLTLSSPTPNLDILVTPYANFLEKEDNMAGVINLSKNGIRFKSDYPLNTNENLYVNIYKNEDKFDISVDYVDLDDIHEFNVEAVIRNAVMGKPTQTVVLEEEKLFPTLEIIDNNVTIDRYKDSKVKFTATNVGSIRYNIRLKDNSKDNNVPPDIEVKYDFEYNNKLPFEGFKVYPELSGNILIDAKAANVGEYELTIEAIDSDTTVLQTSLIDVSIVRPKAVISTDYITEVNKYNLDIENPTILHVNCKNVYVAELNIVDKDKKDYIEVITPVIENITHSEELQENGTYLDYNFDINFNPKAVGIVELELILKDDQNDVTKSFIKPIDVFSSNYIPIHPDPNPIDYKNGLAVRISYKEKRNYTLPLVFVNNSSEADYILVSKYPLSQDSLTNKEEISKAGKHRLEYIPSSKLEDNKGEEEGELFKVANPNIANSILEFVKNKAFIQGKGYPVADSIYLDTMLANLNDAHYLACIEKEQSDRSVNWFYHNREGDFYSNIHSRAYYPESPLNTIDSTNGGSWLLTGYYGDYEILYGYHNNSISTKIDYRDNKILPMISSDTHFTHNGQKCGVVEPFGFGIKTYTDVRVVYSNDEISLEYIDPYKNKVDYQIGKNRDDLFTKVDFDNNMFLLSVGRAFIGSNDYIAKAKSGVFYSASYDVNPTCALLDNSGIPKNNLLLHYYSDETFKGNSGYRDLPMARFGSSVYSFDIDKIKDLEIDTKAYFVSGCTMDGSLVCVNDLNNSNLNHIGNMYPDFIDYNLTGSYRTRLLIDENTVYNINKKEGYLNDQAFFNSRIHFLLYDHIAGNDDTPKTHIFTTNKFVIVEKLQSVPFKIESDGDYELLNVDDTLINIDTNSHTLTGLEVGYTEFIIKAKASNKKENIKTIYVKVEDIKEFTIIEVNAETITGDDITIGEDGELYITGYVGNTKSFSIYTEASRLNINSENSDLYNSTISSKNLEGYIDVELELLKVGKGVLELTVSKEGKEPNTIYLNLTVKEPVNTEAQIDMNKTLVDVNGIPVVNVDSNKQMSLEDILLTFNTNIDGAKDIVLWSIDLENREYRTYKNGDIAIDLRGLTKGEYEVFYWIKKDSGPIEDQELEYVDRLLKGKEPEDPKPWVLNSIVTGKFIIYIDGGYGTKFLKNILNQSVEKYTDPAWEAQNYREILDPRDN